MGRLNRTEMNELSSPAIVPIVGAVDKLPTGMASFDVIAKGGLPARRTTLLSGTAGSGKTVFAVQFLGLGPSGDEG